MAAPPLTFEGRGRPGGHNRKPGGAHWIKAHANRARRRWWRQLLSGHVPERAR